MFNLSKLFLSTFNPEFYFSLSFYLKYYGEFLVNKCCELLNESIKIDALLRLMRSIGHMFEVPANNKQIELFEPFLLKAMNLALNPDVYPMTVAICLSMLARPVLQDSLQFMKIIEKCSVMLEQSVNDKN